MTLYDVIYLCCLVTCADWLFLDAIQTCAQVQDENEVTWISSVAKAAICNTAYYTLIRYFYKYLWRLNILFSKDFQRRSILSLSFWYGYFWIHYTTEFSSVKQGPVEKKRADERIGLRGPRWGLRRLESVMREQQRCTSVCVQLVKYDFSTQQNEKTQSVWGAKM